MSYNIDTFKVKELKYFIIPVDSIYKSDRKDWYFERINQDDGTVLFENIETSIKGIVKDNLFHVSEIDCSGEGSGFIMNEILIPAFKDSKGYLEAICIWEGGDSITRLIVNDGIVKEKNIEL